MHKAAKHSALLIGAFIATSFLNYAFGVVLSWSFGPAQYGILGVVQSLLLLSSLVVGSGFAWTATQDVAAAGMTDDTRRRLRAAWLSNSLMGLVLSLGLWLAYLTGVLAFGPAYRTAIPLVALTSFLLAVRAVTNGQVRGAYRFGALGVNLVGEVIIKCVVGLGLVALGLGVNGVLIGFAAGAGLTVLHSLWITRHDHWWRGQGWFDRQVLIVTAPLFIGMLGPALMLNLDLLGLKLLSPEASGDTLAGFYQAAVILARTPVFIAQAVTMVIFSYAARARIKSAATRESQADSDGFSYVTSAVRAWLRLLLPAGLALAIAPGAALEIFFPAHYRAAAGALQISALGAVLLALITLLNGVLQAIGNRRVPALAALVAMVAQVAVLVWLVPPLGVAGAALSLLAAGIVGVLALFPAFGARLHSARRHWSLAGLGGYFFRILVPLTALIVPLALLPDGTRMAAIVKFVLAGGAYAAALMLVTVRPARNVSRPVSQMVVQFVNVLMGG